MQKGLSYRLNVPFAEKEEAKALGAKWNYREKYWYCPGELTDELRRWYVQPIDQPPAQTETSPHQKEASPHQAEAGSDLYKTVTQINHLISNMFYATTAFQSVLVKGEVTNFSGTNNGNYYFAIKDEKSLLNCFMWASEAMAGLDFKLEKGQQVAICGNIEFYQATGKSQLHARSIINLGEGAANLAYLQLREKLRVEGLFDVAHKKPIPKHPDKVGVVTSKDGQAIRDICKVAWKRNPYVQIILYHVNVQGKNAVETIVEGIRTLDGTGVDVIIVGRGGGSDEELKAYNDEMIARTVYEAVTPIVSAVGHEGHWTLIDETADMRVATPSEAAESVCPDVMEVIRRLQHIKAEMKHNMENRVEQRKLLLNARVAALGKNNPEVIVKGQQERLAVLSQRLKQNMQGVYENKKHRCDVLTTKLHGLSPTAKLVNGFGYISSAQKPLVSVGQVKPSDEIEITISDGKIKATVTQTQEIEFDRVESGSK